jgi:hypothetical protein
MMIRVLTALCLILTAACGQDNAVEAPTGDSAASPPATAAVERRPSPPGAMVYFIEPADGAVVQNPVRVVFGLKGAGVAPAGVQREGTGHHHLLIDTGLPDLDQPIPSDANHVHFGGGQTETQIELSPGRHTLQLLFADERHIPLDPPIMSKQITIEVR